MWQIQAAKFTTHEMEKVDFCLPEISATKIMTWKFHADESTERRHNMIVGRDLLTTIVLDL